MIAPSEDGRESILVSKPESSPSPAPKECRACGGGPPWRDARRDHSSPRVRRRASQTHAQRVRCVASKEEEELKSRTLKHSPSAAPVSAYTPCDTGFAPTLRQNSALRRGATFYIRASPLAELLLCFYGACPRHSSSSSSNTRTASSSFFDIVAP